MRDMFHNYDHHINRKTYPQVPSNEEPEVLDNDSIERIVYDIKGNQIGIRVFKDSPIDLVFSFSGDIDGDKNIGPFLNSNVIKLDILNAYHTVMLSADFLGQVKHNCLAISIIDDEHKLKKDTYYIHLYIELETGECYTLFSEQDGFITII